MVKLFSTLFFRCFSSLLSSVMLLLLLLLLVPLALGRSRSVLEGPVAATRAAMTSPPLTSSALGEMLPRSLCGVAISAWRRAPEQHMLGRVGLLPAHGAERRAAMLVIALFALLGGETADPVEVLWSARRAAGERRMLPTAHLSSSVAAASVMGSRDGTTRAARHRWHGRGCAWPPPGPLSERLAGNHAAGARRPPWLACRHTHCSAGCSGRGPTGVGWAGLLLLGRSAGPIWLTQGRPLVRRARLQNRQCRL